MTAKLRPLLLSIVLALTVALPVQAGFGDGFSSGLGFGLGSRLGAGFGGFGQSRALRNLQSQNAALEQALLREQLAAQRQRNLRGVRGFRGCR